ncbi:putative integral membrane protein [Theileria parva strain Muguga]|uniref:Uncharacterized protein n=1 Tax=Theileria parva TaxID=5875 RepID=Q4N961_THEPA|nr:putative integral membrane protein [Theileria parva strain Muguga]EAN33497.1 putative integral membrane protein [Theileria parva strain Muguga]|eukprot:XP_765780.1 hypothetical protein [Theileria parva strain Muguga]
MPGFGWPLLSFISEGITVGCTCGMFYNVESNYITIRKYNILKYTIVSLMVQIIVNFSCCQLFLVTNRKSSKRFTQALDHPRGSWVDPMSGFGSLGTFPGGPYRGSGFSLTTWMGNMYKNVHTPESANEPAAANMALQIFNMVKGVIQTIIAIIVDTVPPMVLGK